MLCCVGAGGRLADFCLSNIEKCFKISLFEKSYLSEVNLFHLLNIKCMIATWLQSKMNLLKGPQARRSIGTLRNAAVPGC